MQASEIDAFLGSVLLFLALSVLMPHLAWWRRALAALALVFAVAFLIASYQLAQAK